jgi:hypothetical protein
MEHALIERLASADVGGSGPNGASRVGMRPRNTQVGGPACCRAATMRDVRQRAVRYFTVTVWVRVPPLLDLTVTDGDEPTALGATRSFQAPSVSTAWGVPIWVPVAL